MNKNRGISTTIAGVVIVIALVIGAAGGYFLAPAKIQEVQVTQPKLKGVLNIGAALPLTGDLATYGENARVALNLALQEINTLLNQTNAGYQLNIIYEDTQTKPDVALTKTQSLASKGCQVILGYYSSGELRNCQTYATTNQLVLISPSSTAISLAIDKPYIFRFCPADDKQGPAMARGMVSLGISHIVSIWRGDTYGDGLVNSTQTKFAALGGTYDSAGIRYDINAVEHSTEVALLAQKVQSTVDLYGASTVAVYAVTFEEIVSIMTAANQYPILSQVKWFGSDGAALSDKVIKDATVANFSATTRFPSTYFAPTFSSNLEKVRDYVNQTLGRTADPYALGMYDELWVVAKCIGFTQQYTGSSINKALKTMAGLTFGSTGWIQLDQFGDRSIGDYQFWEVYAVNSTTFNWKLSGLYTATSDTVTWYP